MMKKSLLLVLSLVTFALPVAGQTLSLEDCLRLSELHDPSLVNAQYSLLSAQAQQREARWEYFPKASLSGFGYDALDPLIKVTLLDVLGHGDQAQVLNENLSAAARENGIKPYYEGFRNGYGVGVTARQPLYAGGRIRSGNRLSDLGVQSALIQKQMTQRAVRDTVESKYWRIVALQEKQRTLDGALSLLDELEKELGSAVRSGVATETDLLKLQLKQRELLSGKYRLDGSLSLLKMDLFDQIGYSYRYLDLPGIRLQDLPADPEDPEHWIDEQAESGVSDESRLLQMRVDAGKLEKRLAVGELLPQAAVGVGYGYSSIQQASSGHFNGWVFASVQIPLTDLGKASQRARRYDYQIRQAETDRDYLESRLNLQVKMLRLEMETTWKELEVARDAASIASRTLSQMQSSYQAGLCTAGELLQAELDYLSAQEERINREIAYRLAVNGYRSRLDSNR